jgi:hypothetical protein
MRFRITWKAIKSIWKLLTSPIDSDEDYSFTSTSTSSSSSSTTTALVSTQSMINRKVVQRNWFHRAWDILTRCNKKRGEINMTVVTWVDVVGVLDVLIGEGKITINDLIMYVFADEEYLLDNINPRCVDILNTFLQLLWRHLHANKNNN